MIHPGREGRGNGQALTYLGQAGLGLRVLLALQSRRLHLQLQQCPLKLVDSLFRRQRAGSRKRGRAWAECGFQKRHTARGAASLPSIPPPYLRPGVELDADHGAGLVDQVDGLVGEEPVLEGGKGGSKPWVRDLNGVPRRKARPRGTQTGGQAEGRKGEGQALT